MNKLTICRICLVETMDNNVIGLFEKYAESEKLLLNVLFDVIGIDDNNMKEDIPPSATSICKPCSVRLIESYEFQKLCQKGWDKLMSISNEFASIREVNDHIDHMCSDCHKSFRFECNLKIHTKVHHSSGNEFHSSLKQECYDMPKTLDLESMIFAQHTEVWIQDEKYDTDEMKPITDCLATNPIEDHINDDDVLSKNVHKTELVENKSKSKKNTRLKKATKFEPKNFDCPDCEEVCRSSRRLKMHIKSAHKSTRPSTKKKPRKKTEPRLCPICGKSFNAKNENGFQKHMFHHDPSIGKIKYYQCELCDRKFLGKRSLEEHMNFHLNIRPYTCEVETCKQSFIYEQSFKNHKKLHLGKDFECNICRKQFITSTNLKYHLTRVHQGVKKYACNQCDKSYFTLQHLKVHQLSHLEKKAYTCDVCNRGITHYASLLSHMLLHTGKPFQCDHCNMAFTHRWRFGKHLSERHNILEIPKKYARKMAEKLVNNEKELGVENSYLDK